MAGSISDADLLELGMKPKRKIRFSPFLLVLLLVGFGAFIGAAYLPLLRAHETLKTEYAALGAKAAELDDAYKTTQADLKKIDAQREELQEQANVVTTAANRSTKQLSLLESALGNAMSKYVQRRQLSIVRDKNELRATVPSYVLFGHHSMKLTSGGSATLCLIGTEIAKDKSLKAAVVAHSKAETPTSSVIAKDYETSWAATAAEAGAVAGALTTECEFPGARLEARGVANQATPDEMKSDGVTFVVTVPSTGSDAADDANEEKSEDAKPADDAEEKSEDAKPADDAEEKSDSE